MDEIGGMMLEWTPGLGDVVMENLADAKVFEANGSKTDYASGRFPGLSRSIAEANTDHGWVHQLNSAMEFSSDTQDCRQS